MPSPYGLLRFLCGSQERDPESPANNRLHQSGNATPEELQQCESTKKESETRLEHKNVARISSQYYRDMTQKCAQQWKEITELESAEKSPENCEKPNELKCLHFATECRLSNV